MNDFLEKLLRDTPGGDTMAEIIVDQSLTAVRLEDEISRRLVQASAIARLMGGADAEDVGKVLSNAAWCIECLLEDASELVHCLLSVVPKKAPTESVPDLTLVPKPAQEVTHD